MQSLPMDCGCRLNRTSAQFTAAACNPMSSKARRGRLSRAAVAFCTAMLFAATASCSALQEIRGKNQFGPEFQHDGVKRSDQIRYYAGQQIEAKWENGWTTAVTYRHRAIDEGNGNQEQLVLFEVGYPLWKAPKKVEKTAERMEDLQRQIEDLRSRLAGRTGSPASLDASASAATP